MSKRLRATQSVLDRLEAWPPLLGLVMSHLSLWEVGKSIVRTRKTWRHVAEQLAGAVCPHMVVPFSTFRKFPPSGALWRHHLAHTATSIRIDCVGQIPDWVCDELVESKVRRPPLIIRLYDFRVKTRTDLRVFLLDLAQQNVIIQVMGVGDWLLYWGYNRMTAPSGRSFRLARPRSVARSGYAAFSAQRWQNLKQTGQATTTRWSDQVKAAAHEWYALGDDARREYIQQADETNEANSAMCQCAQSPHGQEQVRLGAIQFVTNGYSLSKRLTT